MIQSLTKAQNQVDLIRDQDWTRADMLRSSQWQLTIPAVVFQEFHRASADPSAGLQHLDQLARTIQKELFDGSGIVLLRGVPLNFSELVCRNFYLALGQRIGKPIDRYGLVYDVTDLGRSYQTSRIPISQTNAETSFHTDSSAIDCLPDVVGLMCLRPALSGGESQVVSVPAVYQRLAASDPKAISLLHQDYIRDIVTPGSAFSLENLRKNQFPIFSHQGRRGLTFRYMRYWIERGHQKAGALLDAAQTAAFDALDRTLCAEDLVLQFKLEARNILWVNNFKVAHNRTNYQDYDEPDQKRLLLRMWLEQV